MLVVASGGCREVVGHAGEAHEELFLGPVGQVNRHVVVLCVLEAVLDLGRRAAQARRQADSGKPADAAQAAETEQAAEAAQGTDLRRGELCLCLMNPAPRTDDVDTVTLLVDSDQP